jgi:hypothetical protein
LLLDAELQQSHAIIRDIVERILLDFDRHHQPVSVVQMHLSLLRSWLAMDSQLSSRDANEGSDGTEEENRLPGDASPG